VPEKVCSAEGKRTFRGDDPLSSEVKYAGLWKRYLALLVDLLLFCAFFFPVTRLVKGVWLMAPNDHNWVNGWVHLRPAVPGLPGHHGALYGISCDWLREEGEFEPCRRQTASYSKQEGKFSDDLGVTIPIATHLRCVNHTETSSMT
jgi:hypothetical protein